MRIELNCGVERAGDLFGEIKKKHLTFGIRIISDNYKDKFIQQYLEQGVAFPYMPASVNNQYRYSKMFYSFKHFTYNLFYPHCSP